MTENQERKLVRLQRELTEFYRELWASGSVDHGVANAVKRAARELGHPSGLGGSSIVVPVADTEAVDHSAAAGRDEDPKDTADSRARRSDK